MAQAPKLPTDKEWRDGGAENPDDLDSDDHDIGEEWGDGTAASPDDRPEEERDQADQA